MGWEMNANVTALNFSLIESSVKKMQQSIGTKSASYAFIHTILDAIYPTKEQGNAEIITEGSGDMGIDAIHIRDSGSEAQVDLLSFKYRETPKTCANNFEASEIQKIRSFMADLFAKDEKSFVNANSAIKEKCRDIWALFAAGKICQFRVILVSNGLALSEEEKSRFQHFCNSLERVTLEQVDHSGVVRLLSEQAQKDETAKLKAVDEQIFDRSDGDIKGVVANIEVQSLLAALRDEVTGSIKRHLFSDNIRVYLGDDGGYNKEIITSALSDDNYLFWYLNNGITIVCDRVEYQKRTRGPVITLSGFQIVNGAQTCNALFNAHKIDPNKVSDVLLLVKIFESHRKDISNRVAITTNSQARINLRDLHANDDVQKKIERILLTHGLYYERKKNQHIDYPANQRIDALKLGQIILSYELGEPDKAKTESDSIFGHRYAAVFNERHNGDDLFRLIKLYDEIERRRDEFRLEQRRAIIDAEENRFLTYGHWHILFVVSLLANRDGIKIPSLKDIHKYVDEAQGLVARIANEYKTVAHYDMFRSSRFRHHLLADFDFTQLTLDF
jgi:hypothetical protein